MLLVQHRSQVLSGLDEYDKDRLGCFEMRYETFKDTVDVYYDADVHGCPHEVSQRVMRVLCRQTRLALYNGPQARNSTCPVSVATYDISWSEDYILYTKVLSLQSTGGMIEKRSRPS